MVSDTEKYFDLTRSTDLHNDSTKKHHRETAYGLLCELSASTRNKTDVLGCVLRCFMTRFDARSVLVDKASALHTGVASISPRSNVS